VATANAAVALEPNNLMALEVAVAVAYTAGDPATVQRHLESALALRPNDASIHRALGKSLAENDAHAEAEAHWRASLAQSPDDPFALGWLSACLIELDRKEEAREVLRADSPSFRASLVPSGHCARRNATHSPRKAQELFDAYVSRFDTALRSAKTACTACRVIQTRSPELDVA
jgi:tetratricopeptide (TPR) repeat protein